MERRTSQKKWYVVDLSAKVVFYSSSYQLFILIFFRSRERLLNWISDWMSNFIERVVIKFPFIVSCCVFLSFLGTSVLGFFLP